MDLGDLELRGILARKSQLFLRVDCSRAWLRLRCSQINARAKRKYRAPNVGSRDLVDCFLWYCRHNRSLQWDAFLAGWNHVRSRDGRMVFAASTPANRAPVSCNRPCLRD